jgi:hypothetical protein
MDQLLVDGVKMFAQPEFLPGAADNLVPDATRARRRTRSAPVIAAGRRSCSSIG